MILYGKCELPLCGRSAFFIRKRLINIPGGGPATSQKQMCGKCARRIRSMVK